MAWSVKQYYHQENNKTIFVASKSPVTVPTLARYEFNQMLINVRNTLIEPYTGLEFWPSPAWIVKFMLGNRFLGPARFGGQQIKS